MRAARHSVAGRALDALNSHSQRALVGLPVAVFRRGLPLPVGLKSCVCVCVCVCVVCVCVRDHVSPCSGPARLPVCASGHGAAGLRAPQSQSDQSLIAHTRLTRSQLNIDNTQRHRDRHTTRSYPPRIPATSTQVHPCGKAAPSLATARTPHRRACASACCTLDATPYTSNADAYGSMREG